VRSEGEPVERVEYDLNADFPLAERADHLGGDRMLRLKSHRGWSSSGLGWLRLLAALAAVMWLSSAVRQPMFVAGALAQEERNPTLEPEGTGAASTGSRSPTDKTVIRERTFLDSIKAGGYIGIIIILMSIVAVAFVIEHSLSIRKQRLMPEEQLGPLEEMIARGEIDQAIEYCEQPQNYSLATDVILAGLDRYKSSEFGFADYKSAVEEAGEDHTARLYRKTDGLHHWSHRADARTVWHGRGHDGVVQHHCFAGRRGAAVSTGRQYQQGAGDNVAGAGRGDPVDGGV
jgi:hypothetical protein